MLTVTVTLPSPTSIAPTGTLQIRKGTQTLATAPMTATSVEVAVPGLTPGDHTLTAHYAGDDEYDPKTSASVTVKVVTAAATVTLTQSSAQTALGEEHRVTSRVTSEGADVTGGTVNLRVNNVHVSSHPAPGFDVATKLGAGTHTIVARYSGDEAHGGADSAPLTHTVLKATPSVAATSLQQTTSFGATASFPAAVERRGDFTPTGTVRLLEGSTVLATATLDSLGRATLETTALSRGTHSLRVAYDGDANFNGAQSVAIAHEVVASSKRRSVRR
jgi:hypothetical protein